MVAAAFACLALRRAVRDAFNEARARAAAQLPPSSDAAVGKCVACKLCRAPAACLTRDCARGSVICMRCGAELDCGIFADGQDDTYYMGASEGSESQSRDSLRLDRLLRQRADTARRTRDVSAKSASSTAGVAAAATAAAASGAGAAASAVAITAASAASGAAAAATPVPKAPTTWVATGAPDNASSGSTTVYFKRRLLLRATSDLEVMCDLQAVAEVAAVAFEAYSAQRERVRNYWSVLLACKVVAEREVLLRGGVRAAEAVLRNEPSLTFPCSRCSRAFICKKDRRHHRCVGSDSTPTSGGNTSTLKHTGSTAAPPIGVSALLPSARSGAGVGECSSSGSDKSDRSPHHAPAAVLASFCVSSSQSCAWSVQTDAMSPSPDLSDAGSVNGSPAATCKQPESFEEAFAPTVAGVEPLPEYCKKRRRPSLGDFVAAQAPPAKASASKKEQPWGAAASKKKQQQHRLSLV
jgi:hypothetical protein